ncbi:MAG: hypothetical protein SOR89_00225 [Ndongobacter sp.]|nr:hypothetical protein [Ndongobacter sp.]
MATPLKNVERIGENGVSGFDVTIATESVWRGNRLQRSLALAISGKYRRKEEDAEKKRKEAR